MQSPIRTALPEDAAAFVAIVAPIIANTTISFERDPPSPEGMRDRITETLRRYPWLASLDEQGRVNGYAHAGPHRPAPAYRWSVNTSIYLREDARGRGVGKALYGSLLERLSATGYWRAFAGIALPNAASVALHESVGFQPLGVYRKVGFKHGRWLDVGWWQRDLHQEETGEPQSPRTGVDAA